MPNKTPILGLDEIVAQQDAPWLPHNAGMRQFEEAINQGLAVVCTAGGTITLSPTTDFLRNGIFRLTGTPAGAFTFQVPDGTEAGLVAAEASGERIFVVRNESGQTATIDTPTGSTVKPTLNATEGAVIYADGLGELFLVLKSPPADGGLTVNAQTGTSYTLQSSDDQNLLTLDNAGAITVTLPNNLPAGFTVAAYQKGAGQVTFSAAAGASLNNRSGHTKTAAQWAGTGLSVISNSDGSSAVYVLTGDTA